MVSSHLVRRPQGEWLGLDANTVIGEDGFLGLWATTLVVAPGPTWRPWAS